MVRLGLKSRLRGVLDGIARSNVFLALVFFDDWFMNGSCGVQQEMCLRLWRGESDPNYYCWRQRIYR